MYHANYKPQFPFSLSQLFYTSVPKVFVTLYVSLKPARVLDWTLLRWWVVLEFLLATLSKVFQLKSIMKEQQSLPCPISYLTVFCLIWPWLCGTDREIGLSQSVSKKSISVSQTGESSTAHSHAFFTVYWGASFLIFHEWMLVLGIFVPSWEVAFIVRWLLIICSLVWLQSVCESYLPFLFRLPGELCVLILLV